MKEIIKERIGSYVNKIIALKRLKMKAATIGEERSLQIDILILGAKLEELRELSTIETSA